MYPFSPPVPPSHTHFPLRYYWIMGRLGLRVRGALSAMIFEKAMRLTQPEQSKFGVGKIVNLMEVDCMKMGWSAYMIHKCWSLPILFIVGTAMLYQYVGPAALSAIGVIILLFLPNALAMMKGMSYIKEVFSLRDKRVRVLTEYLQGIELIKMLGWEMRMKDKVMERRKAELGAMNSQRLAFSIVGLVSMSTPIFINLVTLANVSVARMKILVPLRCGISKFVAHVLPVSELSMVGDFTGF